MKTLLSLSLLTVLHGCDSPSEAKRDETAAESTVQSGPTLAPSEEAPASGATRSPAPVPDSLDVVVVSCHANYKGRTSHRFMLPSGQAFVIKDEGSAWRLGRGQVDHGARARFAPRLADFYGLPSQMVDEHLLDGRTRVIEVVSPSQAQRVHNYGVESAAFDRVMSACEALFQAIPLSEVDASAARDAYLELGRWAERLPSADAKRVAMTTWLSEIKKHYPFRDAL